MLKFGLIWLAINILLVATVWYGVTTIRRHFPDWWRRTIADEDPEPATLIKVRVLLENSDMLDQKQETVRYVVGDQMTAGPDQADPQPMSGSLPGGMAVNKNH
jgi:hypothetical protein